jgi:hypothetical protein
MTWRPVIWVSTALYMLFFIVAWKVQNRVIMETLRAFLLAASVAVAIAYSKPAVQAIMARKMPDLVSQLTLGIALAWATTAVQSAFYMIWRLAGQPAWMVNTDFSAFLLYSLCLAAVLHITAPGAIDGQIPKRNMVALGLAAGAAALIIGLIIVINPDVGAFVEYLKPWLYDPNDVAEALKPRAGFTLGE